MTEHSEPKVRLGAFVEWLNEHTQETDAEAERIAADQAEVDGEGQAETPAGVRRERALGGVVAKQKILRDFTGLIVAQSHEARGDFDDVRAITDSQERVEELTLFDIPTDATE